jgi:hypothetical protein
MALDPLAPLKLSIRIGIGVLRFELRVLEQLLGLDQEEAGVAQTAPPPSTQQRARARQRPRPPRAPEPPLREPEPEAPPREPEPPRHIDTEPELVGEFAEVGAEEGAGPEIHVDEPWEGYGRMAAADIQDRVAVAGAEELAVIELYERTHRKRPSVLDVVKRRSKELANAPARS